jgi:putative Mg2+ transporter-C (MgtC) family protein
MNLDRPQVISHLGHVGVAYALALPIGLDRQSSSRNFGLRTYPLVSVVACGFILVGVAVIHSSEGQTRVFQGIITGIGFIGGGAIFKGKDHVVGMVSATSLWNTGAIGVAVTYDRFEIAIILSLLNFLTLYLVGRLKKSVDSFNADEQ